MRQEEILCRGCRKSHQDDNKLWVELRYDHYGIETGYWCEECYQGKKYPYRKDAYYDYLDAGEYLYDDY